MLCLALKLYTYLLLKSDEDEKKLIPALITEGLYRHLK